MLGMLGLDCYVKYLLWVVNLWNGVEFEVFEYQKSVVDLFWCEMDLCV